MRVVVDTNVLVSGIFFGGAPGRVVESVVLDPTVTAFATAEIIEEYEEVVAEMLRRGQGRLRRDLLGPLVASITVVEARTQLKACRDPDDDKFLACALDAAAPIIVSGDKDLLSLERYNGVEIITAREFCDGHLG